MLMQYIMRGGNIFSKWGRLCGKEMAMVIFGPHLHPEQKYLFISMIALFLKHIKRRFSMEESSSLKKYRPVYGHATLN